MQLLLDDDKNNVLMFYNFKYETVKKSFRLEIIFNIPL